MHSEKGLAVLTFIIGGVFGAGLPACAVPTTAQPPVPQRVKAGDNSSPSDKVLKNNYLDTGPYMVRLSKAVSSKWNRPKTVKETRVKFQVLKNGKISGLMIDLSSGDPENDKAAIDAVAKAAPFEPLPDGINLMPITYSFGAVNRSGMNQIPVSERRISLSLSNEAARMANHQEFEKALDNLDFAFERDPKNAQISHVLRQIAAYIDDDTPDKVHLLHRILAIEPLQYGAIEKLDVLHKAAGIDPNSASQRMALGDKQLAQFDAEGALAEYSAANNIKEGTCPTEKMAEAYRIMAGKRMARKWEKYLKVCKNVEAYCGMGRSYQLAGDYDKAEEYYKLALERDLGSTMAKNLLARLEEEKKTGKKEKIDVVIADHHTGDAGKHDLVPRAQILMSKASEQFDKGDLSKAIEYLKDALKADPQLQNARQNLSIAYNNQGNKLPMEVRSKTYRKALFIWSSNDTARKNLDSHVESDGANPTSYTDRMRLASQFAEKGDYVSATVEAREALRLKKSKDARDKVAEYEKKAPGLPD